MPISYGKTRVIYIYKVYIESTGGTVVEGVSYEEAYSMSCAYSDCGIPTNFVELKGEYNEQV